MRLYLCQHFIICEQKNLVHGFISTFDCAIIIMSLLIQGTANVNTEAMQVGTTQPCLVRSNDASIKDVFLVMEKKII